MWRAQQAQYSSSVSKRIERRRVEVGDAVAFYPRTELTAEVLTVVANARSRGESRTGSDKHAVGLTEQLAQVGDALRQRLHRCWLLQQVVDI